MYSKVISGMTLGIDGMLVNVEADISPGLPVLSLVGYLASSVKESGERVRTALKNSGFVLPASRITVNLSPADVKKDGAVYDLAIASAILVSMQIIPENKLQNTIILGELGLSGEVKPVEGVLPIVHYASKQGIKRVILPIGNISEAALVEGITIIGVEDIVSLVEYLSKGKKDSGIIKEGGADRESLIDENNDQSALGYDMFAVKGQDSMKRGVMLAVSGFHNILMNGAAGSGKSMIAKCIPGIMPPLSFDESIELTKIYSIAGLTKNCEGLMLRRPFRSPHHTVTSTALMGGGIVPKPGEVTLAHNGILFLDELPEFNKNVLEVLRQPMEDKKIYISRVQAAYSFPADFMLVAAMNPCPCGNYPDLNRCTCTPFQIKRYQQKISAPLLDRIDIKMEFALKSSQ